MRAIAKRIGRSPSSISRETRRNAGPDVYDANVAHTQSAARRVLPKRIPKMQTDSVLLSVSTLVERTTRFAVPARMDDAATKSVVDSFSAVLHRELEALRKSMTYDQGREIHSCKILTERTGAQIYFADPHSP